MQKSRLKVSWLVKKLDWKRAAGTNTTDCSILPAVAVDNQMHSRLACMSTIRWIQRTNSSYELWSGGAPWWVTWSRHPLRLLPGKQDVVYKTGSIYRIAKPPDDRIRDTSVICIENLVMFGCTASEICERSDIESDVDRVELFRLTFEIFRRRFDGVLVYFFNSDFKFFYDASKFSVTSFYVVFIFSSMFMLIFSMTLWATLFITK